MPRVEFTANLKRHIDAPACEVAGATLREALNAAFVNNDRLRGYILDDQNRLRQHIVVFIDNQTASDRETLSDVVGPDSEIYVMQALSGG